MNTLQFAELTGTQHKAVLAKVRKLLKSVGFQATDSTYIDVRGKTQVCYLLDQSNAEVLMNTYSTLRYSISAREKDCLNTIEQVLGISLERQFCIGEYRIDGYDLVNKVAYEIDEDQHLSPAQRQADIKREVYIKAALGCSFKRIAI